MRVGVDREGIRGSRWEDVFRRVPYWAGASKEAVDQLADTAVVHRCRRGEILFAEGTVSDRVLVVLQGHARGVHFETSGHVVVLEELGVGDVVGSISALANAPFEGDVEAGAGTVIAWLPLPAIHALIGSSPDAAISVVRAMARRWVAAVSASKRNATTVPARLARYLRGLPRSSERGGSYRVELPCTRVELAATLATSPETLSRTFRRLRADGLIEDSGRLVTVLDDVGLEAAAIGDQQHP